MGKYRNILVAFDGSASSKNALDQAVEFAGSDGCGISAVTVLTPFESEIGHVGDSVVEAPLGEYGERILDDTTDKAEGCTEIRTVQTQGNIHQAVIDTAKSGKFDLIIVGRKGLSRLEKTLMGSVAERIIGYSPVDVLVMPRDTVLVWRKMLLTTDGSTYSEAVTEKALDIARNYGAELAIISVVDMPAEVYGEAADAVDKLTERAHDIAESVRRRASALGIKADAFVKLGNPYEKIVETAGEVEADLICMGTHGRTGLDRLLMGSTAEKVIGHTVCPVLIVKSY